MNSNAIEGITKVRMGRQKEKPTHKDIGACATKKVQNWPNKDKARVAQTQEEMQLGTCRARFAKLGSNLRLQANDSYTMYLLQKHLFLELSLLISYSL